MIVKKAVDANVEKGEPFPRASLDASFVRARNLKANIMIMNKRRNHDNSGYE